MATVQRTHELKTWPKFFEAVWIGGKTAELRKNDRDFQAGDVLLLKEYDPETEVFSGRVVTAMISHMVTESEFGLKDGYVMLSLAVLRKVSPIDRSHY